MATSEAAAARLKPAPQGPRGPVVSNSRWKRPERAVNSYDVLADQLGWEPGQVQQADVLFTTTDTTTKQKYILVVADIKSRWMDAEGMITKSAAAVRAAFEAIYERNTAAGGERKAALGQPPGEGGMVEVDDGGEFKGTARQLLESRGALVRYARPGRHNQQALAESLNKILGEKIAKRQVEEELLTDEPATDWSEDLPDFVKQINRSLQSEEEKRTRELAVKRGRENAGEDGEPVCEDKTVGGVNECILLRPGTKVRVVLEKDRPKDTAGRRLPGSRRAGDIHFEDEVRTVELFYLTPGMTPRYRVSGYPNVLFKRQELREVGPGDDKFADAADVLRGKAKKEAESGAGNFIPLKLHEKEWRSKKTGAKVKDGSSSGTPFYLTEYRGFPKREDWRWEPESTLKASTEGARLVRKF